MIQSGGPPAALVIELTGIADDRHVGLNHRVHLRVGFVLSGQAHIEGGDINPTGLALEGIADLTRQFHHELLMQPCRRGGHGKGLAVDQLPAFLLGPLAIIAITEVVDFGGPPALCGRVISAGFGRSGCGGKFDDAQLG